MALLLGVMLSLLCAVRLTAQTPADTAALPPMVFGVGAVGAAGFGRVHVGGAGLDAEVVIPLPNGVVAYRLQAFGTYLPDYGQVCTFSCTPQGGTLSGASASIAYLSDVHDRVARTRVSIGPALVAGSESGSKETLYLWGADVGITRLVHVGHSSGLALSLEPVLTKPGGAFEWFVMAGVRAEFW